MALQPYINRPEKNQMLLNKATIHDLGETKLWMKIQQLEL
jgi:hypothetical protein